MNVKTRKIITINNELKIKCPNLPKKAEANLEFQLEFFGRFLFIYALLNKNLKNNINAVFYV